MIKVKKAVFKKYHNMLHKAILLALLLLPLASHAQFRSTTWGMSANNVKGLEKTEFIGEGKDMLAYKTHFVGTKMMLYFMFQNDRLYRGSYVSMEIHVNPKWHIKDYERCKLQLEQYFGKPLRDESVSKNDTVEEDPEKQGMAILSGDLMLISSWVNAESKVTIICSGDGKKVTLEITYEASNTQGK